MQIIYPKDNKPYFDNGRRIIKIRTPLFEQAFYQSSGLNTRVGGTWFPFDGIDSHDQLNKSFVVTIAKFKFGIKNCRDLANNRELSWEGNPMEKIDEIFCRLGNCYYASISQALGGPLWQGEIGKLFNPVFKQKCGNLRAQLGINKGYKVNDGYVMAKPIQINNFVGKAITINFRDNLRGTTFERFFKF